MPPANAKTILAFDVGLKRTGVAAGQTLTRTAEPVTSISGYQGQLDWQQFDRLVDDWQPSLCVVGDPKTQDPHLNKLIRRVIHRLQELKIQVLRVDETLSSVGANAELVDGAVSHTKKQALRDQIAACLILETYFNELADPNS